MSEQMNSIKSGGSMLRYNRRFFLSLIYNVLT